MALGAFVEVMAFAGIRCHVVIVVDAGLPGKELQETPEFRCMTAGLPLNIQKCMDHLMNQRPPGFFPAMKPKIRCRKPDQFAFRKVLSGSGRHPLAECNAYAGKPFSKQLAVKFAEELLYNGEVGWGHRVVENPLEPIVSGYTVMPYFEDEPLFSAYNRSKRGPKVKGCLCTSGRIQGVE